MPDYERLKKEREDRELYARLTVPWNVSFHSFREHCKVEGLYVNNEFSMFNGCDVLYKIDTLYGITQMGYSPGRQQSLLFSNIKTSVFDNASSKYKQEMREPQMMRSQKGSNENIIYNSRRRADSASLLFKAERKPWTADSIRPYLNREGQGALRKTMPFLNRSEERKRLVAAQAQRRALALETRQDNVKREKSYTLLREEEFLNSVLWRKSALERSFFRKINYAFDVQKHEMFSYYREIRQKNALTGQNAGLDNPDEEDDR